MIDTPELTRWRHMPPAVFPPVLGVIGLSLAWIRGGAALGFGLGIGYAILIVATILYGALLVAYLAKLSRRHGVFREELESIPGRLGLATMLLCAMLIASALSPIAPNLASALVFFAFCSHIILAASVLIHIVWGGPMQRKVTPVWHLTFVGFIVATQAFAQLDYTALTLTVFALTFIAALGIYGVSLEQMKSSEMPVPMRPAVMIHLAPISLFGVTASLIGLPTVTTIFTWCATGVFIILLSRLRWIVQSGFTPFWSSFTFPVAAYTGLLLSQSGNNFIFKWLGILLLALITIYIPIILCRVLIMFWDGRLAKMTKSVAA